ncbi:MAG: hypothetical protein JXB25_03700 [Deltaproteobacteria bacterium]|nr:hypothetical protein [Deltaproteobacteria bacterium]
MSSYNPNTQSIAAGKLVFSFSDSDGNREEAEIRTSVYDGDQVLFDQIFHLTKRDSQYTLLLDLDGVALENLQDGQFLTLVLAPAGQYGWVNDFKVDQVSLRAVVVPLPGAFLLLGSWLLGIFGLRVSGVFQGR